MASNARHPRKSGYAKQFAKDWKRLERSGRYPMQAAQIKNAFMRMYILKDSHFRISLMTFHPA
jgi:mRNA-degrading endonuclease YafQ of YafQ-DinJ toxin-antitoxin module